MERIHPTGVVTTNGKWLIKQITCYLFIISLTLVGILSGNRAITVLREQIPVERYHTIVIDAGHGGEDGGATSSSDAAAGVPDADDPQNGHSHLPKRGDHRPEKGGRFEATSPDF